MCICFSRDKEMESFEISLNNTNLKCVEKVKDLGIIMTHNMSDEEDIRKKRGEFIGRTNYIIARYGHQSSIVKSKLFNSYCSNVYGAETWNFKDSAFSNLATSWNIAVRTLWGLPYNTHRKFLPGLNRSDHIKNEIYARTLSLYQRMYDSENEFVSFITLCSYNDARSIMRKNIRIMDNCIDQASDFETLSEISILNDLRLCMDGITEIEGFSKDEIEYMYEYTATF